MAHPSCQDLAPGAMAMAVQSSRETAKVDDRVKQQDGKTKRRDNNKKKQDGKKKKHPPEAMAMACHRDKKTKRRLLPDLSDWSVELDQALFAPRRDDKVKQDAKKKKQDDKKREKRDDTYTVKQRFYPNSPDKDLACDSDGRPLSDWSDESSSMPDHGEPLIWL